jgi:cytosine/adenosine deaminase-related metal-dependent hydrolase
MSEGRFEPGFVNAHTHCYSGLAPLGMPTPAEPPESFVEILERVWWRLDRSLDAPSLRASARYYVAHALLAGTTGLVDHHESPAFIEGSLDVLAEVCAELGVRALLCYGATERNGGRDEAKRGLTECRRFIEQNRHPLVRGAVGLHAPFTVSDPTIREAGELCRELAAVLHLHVAESPDDVEDARRLGYEGPVERLIALGALVPGSILAHGVHLDRAAVELVAGAGAWIVQNPRSNQHNRVGYPAALGASEMVAIGTDGFPSDPAAELDTLSRAAAAQREAPSNVNRRLARGRRLLERHFGAEAVTRDRVHSVDGRVLDVVVDGRTVVSAGKLRTADLAEIDGEARRLAPALWTRMNEL